MVALGLVATGKEEAAADFQCWREDLVGDVARFFGCRRSSSHRWCRGLERRQATAGHGDTMEGLGLGLGLEFLLTMVCCPCGHGKQDTGIGCREWIRKFHPKG